MGAVGNCERGEGTICRAMSLSSTSPNCLASSRRQLQQGSQALTNITSPEAVVSYPWIAISHALWLCAASRSSPASLPILLACRAAHIAQLASPPDDFVACIICHEGDSGLVQVRLESVRSDVQQASLSRSSPLQPPKFLNVGYNISQEYFVSPKHREIQTSAAVGSAHYSSMQGESACSCRTIPLVAGLWQSLPALPPYRSGLGVRASGTSVCCQVPGPDECAPLSPKSLHNSCGPHSPKLSPLYSMCATSEPAARSESIHDDEIESGYSHSADLSSGSSKQVTVGPFEMHTPETVSQAETGRHQHSLLSLELTSRSSPASEHRHCESCTDERCDALCKHTSANMTPVTAHPVSLMSEPQHVISPPLSSVDGDEGVSGQLHCGITLGALDSVDEAVTENGNSSEIDQGASDPGVLSAPASVTGVLVNAPEHEQQGVPVLCDVTLQEQQGTASTAAAEVAEVPAALSECGAEHLVESPDSPNQEEVTCHLALLYDDDPDQEPCLPASQGWGDDRATFAESLLSAGAMSAECLGEQDERSLQGSVEGTVEPALPEDMFSEDCMAGIMESIPSVPRQIPDCSTPPACSSAATCPYQNGPVTKASGGNQAVGMHFRANCASSSTPGSAPLPHALHQHSNPFRPLNRSVQRSYSAAVDGASTPTNGSCSSSLHPRGSSSLQQNRSMSQSMRDLTAATPVLPPLPSLDPAHVSCQEDALAISRGPGCPRASLDSALAAGPAASSATLVPPELPPLLPAATAPVQRLTAAPQNRDEVPGFLCAPRVDLSQARGFSVPSPQPAAQCFPAEECCVSPRSLVPSPSVNDPPDVPILSRDNSPTLFSLLDQHLLDRIMLHVSATNSLNAAASVCRRFRNAARRLTGSATLLPSPSFTPPIDPATGALDLHPLQNFTGLHTLRLPKFDRMRKIEVLPVELFRLRMLTQLTYLDIQCAAYVPTFQPLRLLPSLRHVSCAGASLNPAPDLPELPNCELMLYANRGLSAATRRNVLSTLPPLSGLRVPSKAPAALLQQIGSSPSMRTLTYLRLGSCQSPALDPLSPLTQLVRLHLHVVNGHVTPLTTLSMLTYLHLHGQVDDLAVALGSFRRLQKLSLIKCKRLRADEVRAVGTLAALTSLELPCSKTSSPPRDIRPLARLKNLQHLSLAMPESGISPLTRLSALTFLRLKYRAPDSDPTSVVPRLALTASLFSVHLAVSACTPAVRVLAGGGAQDSSSGNSGAGGGSAQGSLFSAAMSSVLQSTSQAALGTAVTLAGAAAVPLAAYATRRAWTAVSQTLFPPVLDAGRLSDLCHMTQLEWLEVKSSTMPTPEEWSAALRPLTCLRRLDVRNTSFRDPLALQDMPNLQVVLISGCSGLPRTNQALQEAAALRDDVEIRR